MTRGTDYSLRSVLLILALLFFAACYLLWAWYRPAPAITPVGYLPAPVEQKVAGLPTVAVPVKTVRALPKSAIEKLNLPPEVAADPAAQVLSAVTVPPTLGGATAVTVIDTSTGEARTLVREKPRRLLSFESGTELGLRYGITTAGGQQAALYARRDLLRIGSAYVALYGEASSRPEARAMIDVSLRW